MLRKNFTSEQIINKLKEAEVYISQGMPITGTRSLHQTRDLNGLRRVDNSKPIIPSVIRIENARE